MYLIIKYFCTMSKHLYFYSHKRKGGEFSQFYPCAFKHEGETFYSAEQWMMASKARLMGDEKTRRQIMKERSPMKIKSLGRRVTPFNQRLWEKERFKIVFAGNMLKFNQDDRLRKKLKDTGNKTLVEAAPRDKIWGIGISVKDATAGKKWKGQNLLGKALMKVRKKLTKR